MDAVGAASRAGPEAGSAPAACPSNDRSPALDTILSPVLNAPFQAELPASTTIVWPVMAAERGESRKQIASATSAALVPEDRHSAERKNDTTWGSRLAVRSVVTNPGRTAFTLTLRRPASRA